MTAIAAAELGYRVHVFTPEADSPAAEVAKFQTVAEYSDAAALAAFAESVDLVTYEFENIPLSPVVKLAESVPVHPSPRVLEICQHRVKEKQFVQSLGIGTAPFRPVGGGEAAEAAAREIGVPAVLKTCTLGYDGKGQVKIASISEASAAYVALGGGEAICEGFVDFTMEISVLIARNAAGETACYPPVQNIHRDHILHRTIAPAPIPPALAQEAERMARAIAQGLSLVGLLAVEMFVAADGRILVNELAPRPHNSGHWTLDACVTSQFSQLVRAVCGLPLGDPAPLAPAEMINLIGNEADNALEYLNNHRAQLHLYGKREARPGRKMGHVTVVG